MSKSIRLRPAERDYAGQVSIIKMPNAVLYLNSEKIGEKLAT